MQIQHHHPTDQQRLGNRLGQFGQGLTREHPPDALDRIEFAKRGSQRLGGEHPAAQQNRPDKRQHDQQRKQRQQGDQRLLPQHQGIGEHDATIQCQRAIETESLAQNALQGIAQHTGIQPQRAGATPQQQEGRQLARAWHLPFLAGLLQTVRCRLFRLVVTALLVGHLPLHCRQATNARESCPPLCLPTSGSKRGITPKIDSDSCRHSLRQKPRLSSRSSTSP